MEWGLIFIDSCFIGISIIFIRAAFSKCIFICFFPQCYFYFCCFWFAWSDFIGRFFFLCYSFFILLFFDYFLIANTLRFLVLSPNIQFIPSKSPNIRFTKLSNLHGFLRSSWLLWRTDIFLSMTPFDLSIENKFSFWDAMLIGFTALYCPCNL